MKDDPNELFVVVDEEDNVLGYRTRADCHSDKSLIHRGVGVSVINDKGEILLQKRSQNKDTDPGLYDLAATGHVGKDESYEEAARRELSEELGIAADLAFVDKMIVKFPTVTEFDAVFRTTHNGPFAFNKDEIDEVVFVTEEDLKDNLYDLTVLAKKVLIDLGVL